MRIFTVIWTAGLAVSATGYGIPASSGEAGSGGGSSSGSTGGLGNSETGLVTGGSSSGTGAVSPTVSTGMGGTDGTSEGSGEGTSTGCQFICETTGLGPQKECDNFLQDCPEGQKCAAWADDGFLVWNALKCVPVMGDRQPGEPCMAVESGVSGLDDCAEGVMCWFVDETLMGECVALCTGVPEAPICPKNAVCYISAEAIVNICLPDCDPLVQGCGGDLACIPILDGDHFSCEPNASLDEGQVNEVCESSNACDKGLACLDPVEASSACDPAAAGCCQPFCEFPGGGCPNPDQVCVQWYDEMQFRPDEPESKYGVCKIGG